MKQITFRSDVVGSMLRPKFLLEAQEQLKKGEISEERIDSSVRKIMKAKGITII